MLSPWALGKARTGEDEAIYTATRIKVFIETAINDVSAGKRRCWKYLACCGEEMKVDGLKLEFVTNLVTRLSID